MPLGRHRRIPGHEVDLCCEFQVTFAKLKSEAVIRSLTHVDLDVSDREYIKLFHIRENGRLRRQEESQSFDLIIQNRSAGCPLHDSCEDIPRCQARLVLRPSQKTDLVRKLVASSRRHMQTSEAMQPLVQTFFRAASDARGFFETQLFAFVIEVNQVREQLVNCRLSLTLLLDSHHIEFRH